MQGLKAPRAEALLLAEQPTFGCSLFSSGFIPLCVLIQLFACPLPTPTGDTATAALIQPTEAQRVKEPGKHWWEPHCEQRRVVRMKLCKLYS